MAKIQANETLHDFAKAMDDGRETLQFHFDRVLASGRMSAIKSNIRGQISTVESKLNAVIERSS